MKKIKFLSTKLLIIYLIGGNLFFNRETASVEKIPTPPSAEYIRNLPDDRFYILGIGDKLSLKVSQDSTELDQIIKIDGQGTVFLKRLKKVFIQGLTIKELTAILNKEYSEYVLNPEVELSILEYRPVKVYVDGAVENPGIQVLPGAFSPLNSLEVFNNDLISENVRRSENQLSVENNVFFPSVIDALRSSGGIKINADLQNIEITRKNNITDGGGRITTKINLLSTLDLKDLGQNVRILDGDTIKVDKSKNPVLKQISKAIKSNINPRFINVIVGGRVENPGPIKINKTGTLNDAIELAGGAKIIRGSIIFLRYNNDGSIDRRKFRYNPNSIRGSQKNPYLSGGDIVYIGKGNLNKFNEAIKEVTAPIPNIIQSYTFYKLLTQD